MSELILPRFMKAGVDRFRRSNAVRNLVVSAADFADLAVWKVQARVDKYDGFDVDEFRARYGKEEGDLRFAREARSSGLVVAPWNVLTYGGVSCLWQCLIGNGTATAAQNLTYFNNTNAYIGVGDSATAEAATQTDLQAATNKLRQVMDATFPTHTDATTSGAATITFKVTFGTGAANWAWNEYIIANGSSGGRALNRKTASLGTKTSAASWAFTVTITIS